MNDPWQAHSKFYLDLVVRILNSSYTFGKEKCVLDTIWSDYVLFPDLLKYSTFLFSFEKLAGVDRCLIEPIKNYYIDTVIFK